MLETSRINVIKTNTSKKVKKELLKVKSLLRNRLKKLLMSLSQSLKK